MIQSPVVYLQNLFCDFTYVLWMEIALKKGEMGKVCHFQKSPLFPQWLIRGFSPKPVLSRRQASWIPEETKHDSIDDVCGICAD